MKVPLSVLAILSIGLALTAQTRTGAAAPPSGSSQPAPAPGPNLNAILADVQRVAVSTNGDLGKLRIEKWKTDDSQKKQMQQVADSLQRNIAEAVPGLISDLQAAPGSVAKAFKLYHNLNVLYEFLNSLAEAAGAFGKKDEYEPLATDASSLDTARQRLSDYIEQTATNLESQTKAAAAAQAQTVQTPKKVVIDDNSPPKKTKKKKTSSASTPPSQ